jgi:hypothetical protein
MAKEQAGGRGILCSTYSVHNRLRATPYTPRNKIQWRTCCEIMVRFGLDPWQTHGELVPKSSVSAKPQPGANVSRAEPSPHKSLATGRHSKDQAWKDGQTYQGEISLLWAPRWHHGKNLGSEHVERLCAFPPVRLPLG